MTVVLGSVTALSGLLLGTVNHLTEKPREEAELSKTRATLTAVTEKFDNDPQAEATAITLPSGQTATVYPAKINGILTGAAVESRSMNGFSGEIRIMTGFDNDGRITGYKVLRHSETPGLGAKMTDWFSKRDHRGIIGRNPSEKELATSKNGGDIDGITAATISSKAFLEAVNSASEAFQIYKGQYERR